MRLLAYVVVADQIIHQEEIDAFLENAGKLELAALNGAPLTREWLRDWFLQCFEKIKDESSLPEVDSKLVNMYMKLQSWPKTENLLAALRSVAASDGNYHINEKVLVSLAAAYWDLKTPEMK